MPSQALQDLNLRLKDIDQLLEAHTALTKFKKAEKAAKQPGLRKILTVVDALVTAPGKGKPAEVDAINRAAFVLLTAHFQGFVDDLHKDLATKLLTGKVTSVDEVIELAKPRNANPHSQIIEKMFGGLGVFEVMSRIKWQKCSNDSVKKRLTGYIQTRNKIAHGSRLSVTKQKVKQYMQFVQKLAEELDKAVSVSAKKFTGITPW